MAGNFVNILETAVQKKASDIHVVIGQPPMVRIMGEIRPLEGFETINPQDSQKLIYSVLYDAQRRKFSSLYFIIV